MTTTKGERFPFDDGAMAAKIRAFPWQDTPLGAIDTWPAAIRIAVDMALSSRLPICLFLGPDLIAIYNDAYVPLLGTKANSLGEPFRVTWSEAWDAMGPIALKALAGEATFFEDYPIELDRFGQIETGYFTFSYSPIRDETGAVVGMIDAVVETTGKVLAERQLSAERSRLSELFEQSPHFMALLRGPEHRFEHANPRYRQLVAHRDIIGNTVGGALPETIEQGFVALLDQVYASGEAFTATGARVMLEAAPGGDLHETFLDFVYQPIRDADGAVSGIFVEGADVTERARAEEALRASEEAVRLANETLEAKVEARTRELMEAEAALRQSQKMEAVGQLTGGIAHDFNNMLAVVMGSLDLLGRRLDDPRAKRLVDAALDASRRAANLTQRLLAFSRQTPLRPQVFDPNRLVSGMSDLLKHALGADIRLETVLAGGVWRTEADPNQLESVILNLGVNARDAMPNGGKLTIETQNAHLDSRYSSSHIGVPKGQYVLIAVSDTGTGMTGDVLAKAFDPFFTTKDPGKGTGLGLSQVYGFVKQSGGHIKIYSEPGDGTTVKIYLPRVDRETEEDLAADGDLALGDRQEVILVVDDEPAVRQFSVEALNELGYRVLEADSAANALPILAAHPEIALLFTDIVMPDTNGRGLAEAALKLRPELKVLYTTGYTRNAVVHNGVVDKGVELIGKPFTVDELAARVRDVLDGN